MFEWPIIIIGLPVLFYKKLQSNLLNSEEHTQDIFIFENSHRTIRISLQINIVTNSSSLQNKAFRGTIQPKGR